MNTLTGTDLWICSRMFKWGVKGLFHIDQVFWFYQSFDHEWKISISLVFTSTLPQIVLSYVLTTLNAKTYTKWWECLVLLMDIYNYDTKVITFSRVYFLDDWQKQSKDWLASMEKLRFSETQASWRCRKYYLFSGSCWGKRKNRNRKLKLRFCGMGGNWINMFR